MKYCSEFLGLSSETAIAKENDYLLVGSADFCSYCSRQAESHGAHASDVTIEWGWRICSTVQPTSGFVQRQSL